MGCRLTRTKHKAKYNSHQHHQEELHFVDGYGQPITMQVDRRRGRGHRRRLESSTTTERQWEALRALGLTEEQEVQENDYGPDYAYLDCQSSRSHVMSPDLQSTRSHMMSPDVYLPSVSYSLDQLDKLDHQDPEILSHQPNSESCLIGCYSTEEVEPQRFLRQSNFHSRWQADHLLTYLPLSELDSPFHQVALSEVETDAMSSLPGHTPSSQGSSSSSESLISSELSDSGFHSVGTGEHRQLCKIHGSHAHRHSHHFCSGHPPRDQRGRWDLDSIPEMTPATHMRAPQPSHCTVGNSTTTTVHFHRAERSPTLPRQHPPLSPSMGCHTAPCQRRGLWSEQQQGGSEAADVRECSAAMTGLSEGQQRRRASHPDTADSNGLQNIQPGCTSSTLGPRSRASYPNNCHLTAPLSVEHSSLTSNQSSPRNTRKDDSVPQRPGTASSAESDWFSQKGLSPSVPFYNTLGAPHRSPRSPPSPHCRLSNHRSVRNQLLRARAYRLAKERSEVTTDEEVQEDGWKEEKGRGQEVQWAGRCWSRAERRRQLTLLRQHREKRGGEEQVTGGQGSLSSQMVLEMSHRKQNRLRNSKLLDDWTTVEELLTHGTRMKDGSLLCHSPLLSVTTV